jgi:phenylpropionate dioxygenase-like ring-hydroxylating dioxygenase large terminal subunit
MTFLRNAWYAAFVSSDVGEGKLVPRTLLGENVVVYRGTDRQALVLRDRCPHRFAPLSMGRLEGNIVKCRYHGLKFDRSGMCVQNPHGDGRIPKGVQVRSYPATDRHGFLWVWMGDAGKADPALIPDLSPFDSNPVTATYWGQTHLPVNYLLMQDNLMDFSHIDHLHTAFDSGGCSAARPAVRRNDGRVDIDWAWESERPFAFLALFTKEGPVDSWIHVTWHAPSAVVARLGSTPRGRPRAEGASFFGVHLLCPETELSTFQAFALTRNYAQTDVQYTHQTQKGLDIVNETEDVPMILGAQREMGTTDLLSLHPAMLQNDGGVVMARRELTRMIRGENGRHETTEEVA